MINIILCGGNGMRLWPLSRTLMPKQFIKLFNEKSLFELCFQRNAKICNQTLIVCNEKQYFLALDQSNKLKCQFILEPFPKNTAVAITLVCLSLNKDEIVLVTPSDHLIKNEENYLKDINKAFKLANSNKLIVFGIKPNSPQTGYGYIKFAENYEVVGFYEKPDLESTKEFLKEGTYLWNAVIFVFKVDFFLEQMKKIANEIYEYCLKAYKKAKKYDNVIQINPLDMQKIPNLSIDYALMEKSKDIKLIRSDIIWSDVGSFESLSKEFHMTGGGVQKKIIIAI